MCCDPRLEVSAQSYPSLYCPLKENLGPKLVQRTERATKTLIRLGYLSLRSVRTHFVGCVISLIMVMTKFFSQHKSC